MDPHRRYRGTAPRRILPLVLGLAVLVLGLLGMHTLGVDHRVPHQTAGHVSASAAVHRGAHPPAHTRAGEPAAVAAIGQHQPAAPWTFGDSGGACVGGCHLEMAMAGMCVMALSAGPVFLHLAARAFRPAPGRAPTVPPARPAPPSRAAPRPSLLRLSISRT
jgi:hypothetical protein